MVARAIETHQRYLADTSDSCNVGGKTIKWDTKEGCGQAHDKPGMRRRENG